MRLCCVCVFACMHNVSVVLKSFSLFVVVAFSVSFRFDSFCSVLFRSLSYTVYSFFFIYSLECLKCAGSRYFLCLNFYDKQETQSSKLRNIKIRDEHKIMYIQRERGRERAYKKEEATRNLMFVKLMMYYRGIETNWFKNHKIENVPRRANERARENECTIG